MIREAESPALEERMAKLEGLVEQMNLRLNHLEAEIVQLRTQMTTEIAQLRADIQTNFRWLLGIMIGTWVTIMLTLLFKP